MTKHQKKLQAAKLRRMRRYGAEMEYGERWTDFGTLREIQERSLAAGLETMPPPDFLTRLPPRSFCKVLCMHKHSRFIHTHCYMDYDLEYGEVGFDMLIEDFEALSPTTWSSDGFWG